MSRSPRLPSLLAASLALLLFAAGDAAFRYSRNVVATGDWALLELPDEVLAAARPGLPDLRLETPAGELPFLLEERLRPVPPVLPFLDVVRGPGRETRALLDRGETPDLVEGITIVIEGDGAFLKPVVLEASEDRRIYSEVAKGSLFRVPSATMTTLRFSPNDRRYLRVRFDDRESEPISPLRAELVPVAPPGGPERTLPIPLVRTASGEGAGVDAFAAELPYRHLPAIGLSLAVADPVFSRGVRVYERIVFRDRLSRRLVGQGDIQRSATGSERLLIPLTDLTSSRLLIEIERASAPLSLTGGTLVVRPKRLVFRVPDSEVPIQLRYGSATTEAPSYDLAQALASGLPRRLAPATLGPAEDHGERSSLPVISRGPVLDERGFARKRRIRLPESGNLAYLDLAGVATPDARGVRIVDASQRQVPFIVESEPQTSSLPLTLSTRSEEHVTVARATGFDPRESVLSLELRARAPAYFRREVAVHEVTRDARGPTGTRGLGRATWEQRPAAPPAILSVPIAQPSEPELVIEIGHGDNTPLELSSASLEISRARVDFLFEPGEQLALLSDNPSPQPASYDLGLLSDALIGAPALPASLGEDQTQRTTPPSAAGRPVWFWVITTAALGLVVAALVRVVRSS